MVDVKRQPLVSIGWVVAADVRDTAVLESYDRARQRLFALLIEQFPQFTWEMPLIVRRRYIPRGSLQPLPLLELGVQEKIEHRWDYALVLVPNELTPQRRTAIIGVPSSALEVGVMSSALLGRTDELGDQLVGLAVHILGHLWGLEHEDEGPMAPPESQGALFVRTFDEDQQETVVRRLEEVADARLEEQPKRVSKFFFYWHTFMADPMGIMSDVRRYAPWKIPFRMSRLTAAAAVSVVVLLLGAESWEVGSNFASLPLIAIAAVTISGATMFIFFGQNLSQVTRSVGLREQLARTHIVLFCTLFFGMIAVWIVLFAVVFLLALVVPDVVSTKWLGNPLDFSERIHHAAFMATLGVLGGALGGNLEDEDELKAELFYDEET